MTCKQLGGTCDHEHHGESADDVINARDRHVDELVANDDDTHRAALDHMKAGRLG